MSPLAGPSLPTGIPLPTHRVIVHPSGKGWTWTQVSRNGSAGAVAPAPFDNRSNAKRAATRQAASLSHAVVVVLEGYRRT